jgi:hypothetical protein
VGTAHKSAVLLQQSKLLVAILLEGATSEGGGSVGDGWNCGTSVATLHVVGEYRSIESVVVVILGFRVFLVRIAFVLVFYHEL